MERAGGREGRREGERERKRERERWGEGEKERTQRETEHENILFLIMHPHIIISIQNYLFLAVWASTQTLFSNI